MVRSGWPLRSQPGKSQPACRRPCGPRRVLAPCPGRVATGDWSSGRVPAGCGTAVELTGLGFRRMAVMFASNRSSSKPGWWPRSRSATLTPHAPVAQHGESATLRTWRSQVRVLSGAPGPSAWPPRRWPIADAQERHGHGFPSVLVRHRRSTWLTTRYSAVRVQLVPPGASVLPQAASEWHPPFLASLAGNVQPPFPPR